MISRNGTRLVTRTAIQVPDIGSPADRIVVSSWFIRVGDHVLSDEPIVELLIPGVTVDVPATVDGRIEQIDCLVGTEVSTGDTLGWIEAGG